MLDAAGFNITLCTEVGNCHVDDARNSLVREFLKTECTDFVFIDADVGFRPEDLLKLVSVDRDVIAGVYPKKQDDTEFPVFVGSGVALHADDDGLVEVDAVPTGFLRIKRHVLETLAGKAVGFIGQGGGDVPYKIIFERLVADGRRWSGDYGFCRKWKAEGGKIYVDPEMVFSHTGQKTWFGTLGDHWRKVHGVDRLRFDEAVEALKSGSAEPEHFVALSKGWGNEWAASPEFLAAAHRLSGNILECGSGLSTLVMATRGNVTALEHEPAFAAHTMAMLERYGLKADIICKPLVDGWYDYSGGEYDALVIDGPPRAISDRSQAIQRVKAKTVIWDDYDTGLVDPVVIEGRKPFAIWREA